MNYFLKFQAQKTDAKNTKNIGSFCPLHELTHGFSLVRNVVKMCTEVFSMCCAVLCMAAILN